MGRQLIRLLLRILGAPGACEVCGKPTVVRCQAIDPITQQICGVPVCEEHRYLGIDTHTYCFYHWLMLDPDQEYRRC